MFPLFHYPCKVIYERLEPSAKSFIMTETRGELDVGFAFNHLGRMTQFHAGRANNRIIQFRPWQIRDWKFRRQSSLFNALLSKLDSLLLYLVRHRFYKTQIVDDDQRPGWKIIQ